ncbi:MAG TPA: 4a-hydroxytetrahydrobiopterin dehydratase [Alphaproteobacteria bacterium]|jgi:4a-hydroxytetrahydrobiopterin dehydratase|nr:4a-hydroxytetrahydrobiopterin dehydratase [Alphaproteobacteria bacterium]
MAGKLDAAAIDTALNEFDGWAHVQAREAICNSFHFADFCTAFYWMRYTALMAEKMDHRPEWSIAYNRVKVTLASRDVDGLNERDVALSRFVDSL